MLIRHVVILLAIILPSAAHAQEDLTIRVEEKLLVRFDPHKAGDEGCSLCHVEGEADRGTLLKDDINLLCSRCHEEGEDHFIDPFPYDRSGLETELGKRGVQIEKGGINCITCHDRHAESERVSYLYPVIHEFHMEIKRIVPHWRPGYCFSCHRTSPAVSADKFKYGGDIVRVCSNCHDLVSGQLYIHAVGMVPSDRKKARMPENFALSKDGKISCITCHELKYQCLKKEYYRKEANPRFFRGGPYAVRTALCYNCHQRERYERLNPHDQINDEGELNEDICLYCHEELPDPQKDKGINRVKFVVEDLKDLCQRCHRDRPHPGGHWINFDHLVKPPKRVRFWKSRTEKIKDVYLPLEPDTEKIFCCTCHNPHERGVLRGKYNRGADSDRRLRLGAGFELCGACHADKTGYDHIRR